jgi:hypothetical protein
MISRWTGALVRARRDVIGTLARHWPVRQYEKRAAGAQPATFIIVVHGRLN